jgi:glycine oxidase
VELDAAGARASGVLLEGGERVAAGQVVLAAGAWSAAVAGLPPGEAIPVRPVKGQILRLRDPAGPGLLRRILRFEGGYLVPRADGRYVLGATVEERGFELAATAGGVYELLREAHELVPGITELEIEEVAAGLRPGTPDNTPVIGPARSVDGAIWASGHHRNGVLLAPITGELVAALLAGEDAGHERAGEDAGHERAVTERLLATCSPARFDADAPRQRPEAQDPGAQVVLR